MLLENLSLKALFTSFMLSSAVFAADALANLTPSAKKLFVDALSFSDGFYDPRSGYLLSSDPGTPGAYDTRSSAMYAVGLLLRNEQGDVSRAERIIELVARGQYGPAYAGTPWFGTYPHAPDEPAPGLPLFGTLVYTNYDPNWRDFVGSAWCMGFATSDKLLSDRTVKVMEESLLYAAQSVLTRYQGRGPYANSVNVNVSADNLDEAYTNPWLMGTFLVGFIGDRLNNDTLKAQSDADAQKIYDLFTFRGFNTFSEYNSPTYTGVDLYALALWVKYAPAGSKMRELGPRMLQHQLEDLGTLYHAGLRNLAGPWDRTYGFDMTRYHSIVGQFVTALGPLDKPAIPWNKQGGLHVGDYAVFGALTAALSPVISDHAPHGVLNNFNIFAKGTQRTLSKQVRTNTEDPSAVRNVTAWLGDSVAIGGQSLDEPFVRQSSMVAAVIQWALPHASTNTDASVGLAPRIGYVALSPPTASVVKATATANTLRISFPPSAKWTNATLPSSVVFAVGGFDERPFGVDMAGGLAAVPGLNASVQTSGFGQFNVSYNGSTSFNGFYSFYVTYPVNATWPDVPSITIRV